MLYDEHRTAETSKPLQHLGDRWGTPGRGGDADHGELAWRRRLATAANMADHRDACDQPNRLAEGIFEEWIAGGPGHEPEGAGAKHTLARKTVVTQNKNRNRVLRHHLLDHGLRARVYKSLDRFGRLKETIRPAKALAASAFTPGLRRILRPPPKIFLSDATNATLPTTSAGHWPNRLAGTGLDKRRVRIIIPIG